MPRATHVVRIEYCVPGGATPNAAGLAARILGGWGPLLTVLELVPGTGGIFDVHVDGELLFTKKMLGRYPDPEDVLPLLRQRIGDEVLGEGG
jgi:selenoprotein W-related protein